MTRIRRMFGSTWLWMGLIILGGCATLEGIRQSAYVERLRAQQQQERADEIRVLAAQTQDALEVIAAALPVDGEKTESATQLLTQIGEAQGMIVDRASRIDGGARKSEEWQTASAECAGPPKKPIEPDTDQEDDARRDFQKRAQTVGRIRRATQTMGRIIRGLPARTNQPAESTGGWAGLLAAGLGVTVLGGGGAITTLMRRTVKSVKSEIAGMTAARLEHGEAEAERAKQISDLRAQVVSVADVVAKLKQQLEAKS